MSREQTSILKNQLFKSLLDKYIRKELSNILRYVNLKHPKIFTKKHLKKSLNKYVYNIDIRYRKYTKNAKIRFYRIVKNKIYRRKFKNMNIGKIIDQNKKSMLIFDCNKCNARVWNNGSIIKLENNSVVYGKQCQRKKKTDSNYCNQHTKNNPHDDFNKIPTEELRKHYEAYQIN